MNKKYYYIIIFVNIIMIFFFSGCERKAESIDIELPETPVLSSEEQWAVVTSSYLRIRKEPNLESEILSHLRLNNVVKILEQNSYTEKIEGEEDYWYKISYQGISGWVFGSYLEIYESREKALNAKRIGQE